VDDVQVFLPSSAALVSFVLYDHVDVRTPASAAMRTSATPSYTGSLSW